MTPWIAARQASLSITNSQSLLRLTFIELVMPSNHLILCRPLLLPSIFPSIRVFSSESALHIRWPKYWSFSFSISPSSEFRTDFLSDGLVGFPCSPRDSQESSPTPQFKSISSSTLSFLYGPRKLVWQVKQHQRGDLDDRRAVTSSRWRSQVQEAQKQLGQCPGSRSRGPDTPDTSWSSLSKGAMPSSLVARGRRHVQTVLSGNGQSALF